MDVTHIEKMVATTWWSFGSKRGNCATGLEALMSGRACYVLSALDRPPQRTLTIEVNGEPL